MSAPVDPFPDFVNNVDVADGDKVDARFLKIYQALNKAVVGLDAASIQDGAITTALLAALAVTGPKVAAATLGLDKLTPLVLYGTVNGATGAVLSAGSGGWSSVRNAPGSYTITFSPAFSATPSISGLAALNSGLPILPWSSSHGASSLVVLTNRTSTDAAADCSFGFIAIGPR